MKLEPNYYNHFQDDSSQNNVSLEKPSTTNSTSLSPLTISDETIKALIYWLAVDLVSQWRTQPAERWDIATVFQELDPQLKPDSPDFILANSLLLNSLARSHTSYASFLADLAQSYRENFQERFNDISNDGVIKRLIPGTGLLTDERGKAALSQKFMHCDRASTISHRHCWSCIFFKPPVWSHPIMH